MLPGLMLFACFIVLSVCSLGFDFAFSSFPTLGVIIIEMLAFIPPTYCLYQAQDSTFHLNFRLKVKRDTIPFALGFTVRFALAVSFLSFLANLLIYVICGANDIDLSNMVITSGLGNQYTFLSFIGIVIVSPVVEELFVRGALFSAFEQKAGTATAILLSGVCFAMLHGSLYNFIGPLIAGCAYAFLVYSFGSIWPAIIAHMINNCYYYVMNYLLHLYSSFGIWKYFSYINVILFLLTLYLTLRSLEKQVQLHTLRSFKANKQPLREVLKDCIINPGFFIFISSFIITIALK